MNPSDQPILQLLESYRAAALAKDVDAFLALYDDHVCMFDLWTEWSYEGIDALRGMVTAWFGSLGNERISVEFSDVRTTVSPDLAMLHAFLSFTSLATDDTKLRAISNRLTWVLQPREGAWKIVHEHTSAPADLATRKVILQR
ncbi:MAG: SgcJ/EcaC family oxidoreductase [Opitutaceae bacterium]